MARAPPWRCKRTCQACHRPPPFLGTPDQRHGRIRTMAEAAVRRNINLEEALENATARYSAANPVSAKRFDQACAHLPGGNTRSILHFSPFPLTISCGGKVPR